MVCQTGVVVMSIRGCSLLQETMDDLGPWAYTLGTCVCRSPRLTRRLILSALRNVCRPLCAWRVPSRGHHSRHLEHRLIVRIFIAVVVIGTSLIESRCPIGPGALLVSCAGSYWYLRSTRHSLRAAGGWTLCPVHIDERCKRYVCTDVAPHPDASVPLIISRRVRVSVAPRSDRFSCNDCRPGH